MAKKQYNFDKLMELLSKEPWPQVYYFKFIVPADNKLIARVQSLFNSQEANISMRRSSKGKYITISAKEMMLSAESVVERYKKASEIEGIISL
ncbi:DUF493 family protein [Schleiferia thermophila]|jgi:putative lipoic acid-binding regulatory protein|uniref:DUF493 domain-containing protein n=1 Tax=Schleiferia thermophila TaxID=884107 RepID=A0A369A603_9FLAO|nr:DUF493 family protein [Schleiferia thermophila]KFD38772.1 hypothetical protein AT05_07920 [Schleiferia thermophila str. Yellowstone]PMB35878.1 DUF493 domain-containing protein [Fischerella thermalis CCMEE 5319]RCX04770.1 hypothetical protein DES35_10140 [Schleiferia thermophila]GCD79701.1 DUF493 domain-containing protein [Schleiferia thermophila]